MLVNYEVTHLFRRLFLLFPADLLRLDLAPVLPSSDLALLPVLFEATLSPLGVSLDPCGWSQRWQQALSSFWLLLVDPPPEEHLVGSGLNTTEDTATAEDILILGVLGGCVSSTTTSRVTREVRH